MRLQSTLLISAVAFATTVAVGRAVPSRDGQDTVGPFEHKYVLPKTQAEVLSLLLRLDLPDDTTVSTEPRGQGVAVVISGPKLVHDAVEPLVDLLQKAASERARRVETQRAAEEEEVSKRAARDSALRRRNGR